MKKILILDSGIGGFDLATRLQSTSCDIGIPTEIIYHADSANFPYGEKSYPQLRAIISDTFEKITATYHQLESIIIACNTASVIVNDLCAQTYNSFSSDKKYKNIPIIDIMSNLKQLIIKEMDTTIIATQITSNYLLNSSEFKHCKILALPELASLIEFNQFEKIEEYLKQNIPFQTKKIAYGCTHFPLAHKIFQKLFKAQYFDPAAITLTQIQAALSSSRKFITSSNLQSNQLSILNNYI